MSISIKLNPSTSCRTIKKTYKRGLNEKKTFLSRLSQQFYFEKFSRRYLSSWVFYLYSAYYQKSSWSLNWYKWKKWKYRRAVCLNYCFEPVTIFSMFLLTITTSCWRFFLQLKFWYYSEMYFTFQSSWISFQLIFLKNDKKLAAVNRDKQ